MWVYRRWESGEGVVRAMMQEEQVWWVKVEMGGQGEVFGQIENSQVGVEVEDHDRSSNRKEARNKLGSTPMMSLYTVMSDASDQSKLIKGDIYEYHLSTVQ